MRPVRGQKKSAGGSTHNIALVFIISLRKKGLAKKYNFNPLMVSQKKKKIKPK